MAKSKEIWKDIPGWEGYYQASNMGRVKSTNTKWRKPIILKPSIDLKGYYTVGLWKNNKRIRIKVAKLILLTFVGPNPKSQIDHINTIKTDNKVSNLRYCHHYENASIFQITNPKSKIKNISKITSQSWNKRSKYTYYQFQIWINRVNYKGLQHMNIDLAIMDLMSFHYGYPEFNYIMLHHPVVTQANRYLTEKAEQAEKEGGEG